MSTSVSFDNKSPEESADSTHMTTEYDPEKTHSHTTRTDTEVEQIAERVETRRAERLRITHKSRVRFLKECRHIARQKGYDDAKISVQDAKEFRDRIIKDELEAGKGINNSHFFHETLGIKSDVQCIVKVLDRAVELLEGDVIDTGDWLYYKDFSFDYTQVVSRWPLIRHPLGIACISLVLFYVLTPVLFCVIMPSNNICDASKGYAGWVDALYFASTTISTVGYGDLTVDQDPKYTSFVGSLYMLVAMVVAVVAFSAVASSAFSPLENFFNGLLDRFSPKQEKDMFLHERVRRLKFIKLTEIALEVFAFILLGVFASQIAVAFDDDPAEGTDWTWMTSFYWAVQTTTTIGYGDLEQPESLRYFKIFYLMISTALVGNALGNLGNLKTQLSEIRMQHAWERRPVTKRMIDEMQAYDHDDKVDQYEFMVSSLVSLGKLSSDEIKPIMDKFREHAGSKGYISLNDMEDKKEDLQDDSAEELNSYEY